MSVHLRLRNPRGRLSPRLTIGEWSLLRTRPNRHWRVWRDRNEHGWDVATRKHLAVALRDAWRNRAFVPGEVDRG